VDCLESDGMSTHPETPDTDEAEFVGPTDDGWYRTQIPDWIALCPQVNHTAYRLYVIIRSLILEKQPRKVRLLSHEQLAFLLPGPNGKPSGVRTVKDALQVLTEVGLVSNPDGERIVTSGGKGVIHTRRRYQLHDWPTAKVAMTVWRNAFDKLDAFTKDWRETRTDVFAGENVGRNSAPRSDQAPDIGEEALDATPTGDVSAGQFVGRNSAKTGRDSARRRRNSARHADTTSNDADSLKQFPQGASSSSGITGTSPTPVGAREDEDESPTATTASVTAQDVMSRTDASAEEAEAVLDAIESDAERRKVDVGSLRRYVAEFDARDLNRFLRKIRAQRTPEPRTGASVPRARTVCAMHGIQGACPACRDELRGGGTLAQAVIDMYARLGANAAEIRPDLAENPAVTALVDAG
jgi:hypothetical protein